jgi:formate C-acetyltransferase
VIRDETGLIVDYETEGEFPLFGNNDNPGRLYRQLAGLDLHVEAPPPSDLPQRAAHPVGADDHLERGLRQGDRQHARRAAQGEPFAPGANPMHGRDSHGIHASAASVAKIPYRDAADGISLTRRWCPSGLGAPRGPDHQPACDPRRLLRLDRLSHERQRPQSRHLLDAMDHPEKYPSLTIRVSGYAVNFIRLTREQQMDVINRTFHGA